MGFKFNPFTGKLDIIEHIAIGDVLKDGTEHSVIFVGTDGVLSQDNTNFTFNDSTDTLTVGGPIISTDATEGQSLIASGLVVNDAGGATAADDFRVETDTETDAFLVDASADEINFNVGLSIPLTTQTDATLELTSKHHTVLCDCSSTAITITIPTAVGVTGKIYAIKCIDDTNTCTITATGSEEIDGSTDDITLISMESINVQSDGTNWWII